MLRFAAGVIALGLLATSCAASPKASPMADQGGAAPLAKICKIISHPGKFDGRRISAQSVVVTDYHAFSGVADPACANAYLPFAGSRHPIVGEMDLDRALQQVRGRADKQVAVRVVGVVTAHPGATPGATIAVDGFYDVRVVPK